MSKLTESFGQKIKKENGISMDDAIKKVSGETPEGIINSLYEYAVSKGYMTYENPWTHSTQLNTHHEWLDHKAYDGKYAKLPLFFVWNGTPRYDYGDGRESWTIHFDVVTHKKDTAEFDTEVTNRFFEAQLTVITQKGTSKIIKAFISIRYELNHSLDGSFFQIWFNGYDPKEIAKEDGKEYAKYVLSKPENFNFKKAGEIERVGKWAIDILKARVDDLMEIEKMISDKLIDTDLSGDKRYLGNNDVCKTFMKYLDPKANMSLLESFGSRVKSNADCQSHEEQIESAIDEMQKLSVDAFVSKLGKACNKYDCSVVSYLSIGKIEIRDGIGLLKNGSIELTISKDSTFITTFSTFTESETMGSIRNCAYVDLDLLAFHDKLILKRKSDMCLSSIRKLEALIYWAELADDKVFASMLNSLAVGSSYVPIEGVYRTREQKNEIRIANKKSREKMLKESFGARIQDLTKSHRGRLTYDSVIEMTSLEKEIAMYGYALMPKGTTYVDVNKLLRKIFPCPEEALGFNKEDCTFTKKQWLASIMPRVVWTSSDKSLRFMAYDPESKKKRCVVLIDMRDPRWHSMILDGYKHLDDFAKDGKDEFLDATSWLNPQKDSIYYAIVCKIIDMGLRDPLLFNYGIKDYAVKNIYNVYDALKTYNLLEGFGVRIKDASKNALGDKVSSFSRESMLMNALKRWKCSKSTASINWVLWKLVKYRWFAIIAETYVDEDKECYYETLEVEWNYESDAYSKKVPEKIAKALETCHFECPFEEEPESPKRIVQLIMMFIDAYGWEELASSFYKLCSMDTVQDANKAFNAPTEISESFGSKVKDDAREGSSDGIDTLLERRLLHHIKFVIEAWKKVDPSKSYEALVEEYIGWMYPGKWFRFKSSGDNDLTLDESADFILKYLKAKGIGEHEIKMVHELYNDELD